MARLMVLSLLLQIVFLVESSKILIYIPTPSISHQVPIRPFTNKLIKRGHEVVLITTDPAYERGKAPENLTEIDVHDISYKIWRDTFLATTTGKSNDLSNQFQVAVTTMLDIFVKQMKTPAVQKILYNEKFDLFVAEAWVRPLLLVTHLHKIPTIQISSFSALFSNFEMMGAMTHPMMYPLVIRQKIHNLTMWEKISELHDFYNMYYDYMKLENIENEVLKKNFDPDMPALHELYKNVDMLFLNVYPLWDTNRPVGPNVLYIGGIHQVESKNLPQEYETYLNSSKNGVIYMSFGTNMNPSSLPPSKIQMIVKVFSQLNYDVLWKWDKDELPEMSKNIKIGKWFPQPDLLRHPKVKLFITQGGLQSTDEALTAGVPVICIPMLGDQWYNCEKSAALGLGKKLLLENLDEEVLKSTIEELVGDPSYRDRVVRARNLMRDQPQSALDRAVWWTEHLLRHGGGKHLRPPGAGISWREFLELDLVLFLLCITLVAIASVIVVLYCLVNILMPKNVKKIKKN